jgi:transcription initiation factor TFIIIB Brf1 subunit/transcription initiation factor TFIIB
MLRFSPSTIAAAAVYLARKMTGKSPTWVRELCLPIAL